MTDSTPFVAISSVNDVVFIVIRQQIGNQISEIAMSDGQFSGLMYAMKAIERQFIEDRQERQASEEQTIRLDAHVEAYNPSIPAIALKTEEVKRKKAGKSKAAINGAQCEWEDMNK